MSFDLSQYSTVADRIDAFTKEYTNFRINSEVFDVTIEGAACIRVKVSVYKDALDDNPWSVGWAQDRATKAFALESAETSAYGRALANANYSAKLGTPRPSREEMGSVPSSDVWAASKKTAAEWGEVNPHESGAPMCQHGDRLILEGEKNGKPYRGYKCSEPSRVTQCEMMWMKLIEGEWVF